MSAVLLECARSWEEASTFDWNGMAERAGNVFGTAEWVSGWWLRRAGQGRMFTAVCRRPGEEPFALLPLYVWSRGTLRMLRLLGHGPSDQLGPLCRPEDRDCAAVALRQAVAAARADMLYAEDVPRAEGWADRMDAVVARTASSRVLTLDGAAWDAYLAARSRHFREQVRRRERGLLKEGLRFRRTTDPARLEADLDLLFALHRRRWEGVDTAFSRQEDFHRRFARAALDRGWLRLWFLEAGGGEVAALYNLRFAGVESYYQAGRDPAWNRSAVGFMLLAHAIRDAIEAGMGEFRFGRGEEPYKQRFTDEDPQLETFLVAHGVKGRLAVSAADAARTSARARRMMRRALRTG